MSGFAVRIDRAAAPGIDPGPVGSGEGVSSFAAPRWTRSALRDAVRPRRLHLEGRIDNRAEVIRELGLSADEAATLDDAELALRTVEAWGTDALARLVGPLAIVIHEVWRRRLVLWRDAMGGRGLFYHLGSRFLIAASEPHVIAARAEVGADIDPSRLLAMFAVAEPPPGATFFERVYELPPGHVLRVDPDRSTLRRWYRPESAAIRYRREGDYSEHFTLLFDEAVACRLPGRGRASLLLSGGLDSSLLAATAERVARSTSLAPPLAVSWGFDELTSCDERAYRDLLVSSLGLESRLVIGDHAWPLSDFDSWPRNPNTPEETAYRRLHQAAYGAAADASAPVVLGGVFGDQLFLGSEGWWWSLIGRGRWGRAGLEAARDMRHRGLGGFARYAVAGPAYRHLIRSDRDPRPSRPWLLPRARRRMEGFADAFAFRSVRRPEQAGAVMGAQAAQGVVHESWHTARAGVDLRLPMRDQRLVEFMLRIPADQLDRPGRRRPIVRRALRGQVPATVRTRQDKTSMAALFRLGLRRELSIVRDLIERPGAEWRRFVDRRWLLRTPLSTIETWDETRLYVLWLAICAEAWSARASRVARRGMNGAPGAAS